MKKGKILYLDEEYKLIWQRGLIIKKTHGKTFKLPSYLFSGKRSIIYDCRLIVRLVRFEPRFIIRVGFSDSFLISFHGELKLLYLYNGEFNIKTVFKYREGMNNPLYIANVIGIKGFRDGFYFGDYWGNPKKEEVNIYYSSDCCNWQIIYSFQSGEITHVHNIIPNKFNQSLIVLTGDLDNESKIIEFQDNFNKSKIICEGSQLSRSCVFFPVSKGAFYATDSPINTNYFMYYDNTNDRVIKIKELEGSVIYCSPIINNRKVYFSTCVEGDSNKKWILNCFSNFHGPGIKSQNAYLYEFDLNNYNLKLVYQGKKDFLPFIFQFGTFSFANGIMLGVNCCALKCIDGYYFLEYDQ